MVYCLHCCPVSRGDWLPLTGGWRHAALHQHRPGLPTAWALSSQVKLRCQCLVDTLSTRQPPPASTAVSQSIDGVANIILAIQKPRYPYQNEYFCFCRSKSTIPIHQFIYHISQISPYCVLNNIKMAQHSYQELVLTITIITVLLTAVHCSAAASRAEELRSAGILHPVQPLPAMAVSCIAFPMHGPELICVGIK